ncbi:MAG: hypothetical protein N7Q72_02965 [Spiroplasma sp. Tabriz.8]|nr:hypothetical protein [Spiroplasma sp. Tabriz.8]
MVQYDIFLTISYLNTQKIIIIIIIIIITQLTPVICLKGFIQLVFFYFRFFLYITFSDDL